MKKTFFIVLVMLSFFATKAFSQNTDTIWFKNKVVLCCKILSVDDQYIQYDKDQDKTFFYVISRDSVIKFTQNKQLTIEQIKPINVKLTSIQNAGKELQIASKRFYIGSAISLVGTGLTIGGIYFRNYTVYPNGTTVINKMGNDVLKIIGSAILLAGTITTYTSFSHIWKAGSILVSGDGVGIAVNF